MRCLLRCLIPEIQPMDLLNEVSDDTLIEILARLPVRQILRCGLVCKRWHHLILDPTFAQVHLGRGTATVPFFQISGRALFDKKDLSMGLYFVDWEEDIENQSFLSNSKKKKKIIQKVTLKEKSIRSAYDTRLRCCCDGLLIFAEQCHPYTHFLCNPTTNETAVLGFGLEFSTICGFYFHLPTNSYRLLCVDGKFTEGYFRYYVCGLDLVELKEVCLSGRSAGSSMSCLTIDGFMYMQVPSESCSRHIVKYDLNTEQMTFMPHPPLAHPLNIHEAGMHLIEMESQLGFGCMKIFGRDVIEIWVLENPESWVWTKKYSIKLVVDKFISTYDDKYCFSIRNQELIAWYPFSWYPFSRIFKFHLVLGIAEQVAEPSPRTHWFRTSPAFVSNGKRSFISPHHLLSNLYK